MRWCGGKKGNKFEAVFCWHSMSTRNKNKNSLNSGNICFPTEEDAHGLEFIVNEKWNNIHKQRKENDRIAMLQLNHPYIIEPKNKPT